MIFMLGVYKTTSPFFVLILLGGFVEVTGPYTQVRVKKNVRKGGGFVIEQPPEMSSFTDYSVVGQCANDAYSLACVLCVHVVGFLEML